MILADHQIKKLAGMIDPFYPSKQRWVDGHAAISFGLGSYGYDLRMAADGLLTYRSDTTVDPKRMREGDTARVHTRKNALGETFVEMAPGTFLLGYSLERFEIPPDVMAVVLGKSTIARCGISLLATPLEPGWSGHVTLELTNVSQNWVRVYLGEGIGQVLFFQGEPCAVAYGPGPYQEQGAAVTLPKVQP